MKYDKEYKLGILDDFYEHNWERLVKRVQRRAGGWHNAEDVVQDAFLRAFVYIDNYNPDQDFGGWFNQILFNSLKAFNNAERDSGMSHEEEGTEDLDRTVHLQSVLKDIIADVDALPDEAREVIKRFVFLGDQVKMISRDLKINHHTIRKCIRDFYIDVRSRHAEP